MKKSTLIIILGFIVTIVMAILIIKLATPCNGDYEFNLKETKFICKNSNYENTIKPQQDIDNNEPDTTTKGDPCNVPWQQKPLSCKL